MKNLSNLKGAKALNKTQQQSIFGGIDENDPRIPIPTDDGSGGGTNTGGVGDCGYPKQWCAYRHRCTMPGFC